MTDLMERMGEQIEALRGQAAAAGHSAFELLQEIAENPLTGLANGFTSVVESGLNTVSEIYTNSIHGQLDALQTLPPADQFQAITGLLTANGQTAIVEQLNALPEGLQQTFAANLTNDFEFRSTVFANAGADNAGAVIGSEVLARHLDALPLDERFTELQSIQGSLDPSVLGENLNAQLGTFTDRLAAAPPELQQSFMHAFTESKQFREYIIEQSADPDGTNFVNNLFDRISTNIGTAEEPNYHFDPVQTGAVQDILTTIGNNPDTYNIEHLDRIQTNLEELNRLREAGSEATADEVQAARLALIDSIRDAGGNLPAFAAMQADPDIGFRFLGNLLDPNIDAARAMEMLADELGLDPNSEQYAAFMEQYGPIAEILEAFIQPYAAVIQEHAPGMRAGFNNMLDRNGIIMGEDRVSFEADAVRTGEVPVAGETAREFLDRVVDAHYERNAPHAPAVAPAVAPAPL